MTNLIQTLLLPLVGLIGLVVLIALHDITAAVGVPIIAGIIGVHLGANLPPTPAVTPVTRNLPPLPPPSANAPN